MAAQGRTRQSAQGHPLSSTIATGERNLLAMFRRTGSDFMVVTMRTLSRQRTGNVRRKPDL